jgi:hypothetical protein
MSTHTAINTHQHPTYGDELPAPSSTCPKSTVQMLKHAAASLSPVNLQQPLDQTVEDYYHTHGLDQTLIELDKLKRGVLTTNWQLSRNVTDYCLKHGPKLTVLELERQAHRIARIYAASLQEAEDDGSASADGLCRVDRRLADPRVAALFVRDEVSHGDR